jgi:uncharacterized protein (TIGR02145 family)
MLGLGRWVRIAAVAAAVLGMTFAHAQAEKPKIALYIANDALTPDEKSFLTSKLLTPFTASGKYSVIDRSDIFTQKAATERIKQLDGSVNEKEIYKIGYEAGAKYICMVDLRKAFGRWNIAARIVDVVTAEIYLSNGETDITGDLDKADFSVAAKAIFDQIHGKNSVSGSAGNVAQTQQSQTPAPAPTYRDNETATYGHAANSPSANPNTNRSNIAPPSPPPPPPPPPPPMPPMKSAQTNQQSGGSGTFTDSRDGNKYKTVVIGGKRWMAENLNYRPQSGAWCYDSDKSNCDKYGRLYDWKTAKTVCPAGFHLASRGEWIDLVATTGGERGAAKKLRAKTGMNNDTDEFGFSALLGGGRDYYSSKFLYVGYDGYWWTATEHGNDNAYYRKMGASSGSVGEGNDVKGDAYSVRCVAD